MMWAHFVDSATIHAFSAKSQPGFSHGEGIADFAMSPLRSSLRNPTSRRNVDFVCLLANFAPWAYF
jgi:hypothetical protein